MEIWTIGQDQDIDIGTDEAGTGLKVHRTGDPVNNSTTITGELRTAPTAEGTPGAVVEGSQFTFTYTAASDGKYTGTLPALDESSDGQEGDGVLVRGNVYELFVIDTASGQKVRRAIARKANYEGAE